jgi:hypothetical protein
VNDLLEPGNVTEPGLLVTLPPQAEDLVQLVDPVLYGVLDGSCPVIILISIDKL